MVTRIGAELLELATPDLKSLRALTATGDDAGIHQEERRALFRLSIADILGEADFASADLTYLVKRWPDVLEKYQYDVDAYISRFSFDKVRKEISQAELDMVTKLQSVVGDGATKLLGLPLSLATVLGIYHATSFIESLILCLGALLISVLLAGFTENQSLQLARIHGAFKVIFDPLSGKMQTYPDSIRKSLASAIQGFNKQLRFSKRILTLIRILSWAPTLLAVGTFSYRYSELFRLWMISFANLMFI